MVQDNFDTEVSVCDTVGGRQLVFDFDWEMDNLNVGLGDSSLSESTLYVLETL